MKLPETEHIISEAELLRDHARYRESIRLFRKALLCCRKAGDAEETYYCMRSLGDMYRMTGRFDEAVKRYTEAVQLARAIHAPDKAADAGIGLALSLRARGMWRQAMPLILRSKKWYAKNHDRQGLAFALWAEAGTLRIKGDVPSALKTFRESLRLFRVLRDRQGIGYALCGLGGASRIAGRTKASLEHYIAANSLFSALHDTFGTAYSFCGIANAYRMLAEYKSAFAAFTKASRLYRTIGDRVSYAYTLWGLGTAYKMTGRHQKARTYMMQAVQLFRQTKDPRGLQYCMLGLAEIAFLTGDAPRAKKYLASARKALAKLGFSVEECHAATLHEIIHGRNSDAAPRKTNKIISRKRKRVLHDSCYRRLGLTLRLHSLPLNIP